MSTLRQPRPRDCSKVTSAACSPSRSRPTARRLITRRRGCRADRVGHRDERAARHAADRGSRARAGARAWRPTAITSRPQAPTSRCGRSSTRATRACSTAGACEDRRARVLARRRRARRRRRGRRHAASRGSTGAQRSRPLRLRHRARVLARRHARSRSAGLERRARCVLIACDTIGAASTHDRRAPGKVERDACSRATARAWSPANEAGVADCGMPRRASCSATRDPHAGADHALALRRRRRCGSRPRARSSARGTLRVETRPARGARMRSCAEHVPVAPGRRRRGESQRGEPHDQRGYRLQVGCVTLRATTAAGRARRTCSSSTTTRRRSFTCRAAARS